MRVPNPICKATERTDGSEAPRSRWNCSPTRPLHETQPRREFGAGELVHELNVKARFTGRRPGGAQDAPQAAVREGPRGARSRPRAGCESSREKCWILQENNIHKSPAVNYSITQSCLCFSAVTNSILFPGWKR